MSRATPVPYSERERRFVSARMALAETGAVVAEVLAERKPVPDALQARLDEQTRVYRAAERAFKKARAKHGSPA